MPSFYRHEDFVRIPSYKGSCSSGFSLVSCWNVRAPGGTFEFQHIDGLGLRRVEYVCRVPGFIGALVETKCSGREETDGSHAKHLLPKALFRMTCKHGFLSSTDGGVFRGQPGCQNRCSEALIPAKILEEPVEHGNEK